MRIAKILGPLLLSCLLPLASINAEEKAGAGKQAASAKGEAAVRESLAAILPNTQIDSIGPTPIPGMYEVVVGPRVVYMSEDGRYLVQGSMIDLLHRVNLTEAKETEARSKALASVKEEQMVIFEPDGGYKYTATVFTDIDCGYCRKLHDQMAEYHAEGIRVRYLFYPRAGKGSPSYKKAVNVWCAEDSNAAMTEAKSGGNPKAADCENPVDDHMALAEQLSVRGTPAIYLDTGKSIPGYVPPKRLLLYAMEDQRKAN